MNPAAHAIEAEFQEKLEIEQFKFDQREQELKRQLIQKEAEFASKESELFSRLREQEKIIAQKDEEIAKLKALNSQMQSIHTVHTPATNVSSRAQPIESKASTPSFWAEDKIYNYTKFLKVFHLGRGTPQEKLDQNEKYKWIQIQFDEARDQEYGELATRILNGYESQDEKDLKEEIRWDIAWQIFDEVNTGLHQGFEININCLDAEEAMAIVKQKLFDAANQLHADEVASNQDRKNHLRKPFLKVRVFAILCSTDHITLVKTLPPPTPMSEESVSNEVNENVAFYEASRKVHPSQQLTRDPLDAPKIAGLSGVSNIPPSRSIAQEFSESLIDEAPFAKGEQVQKQATPRHTPQNMVLKKCSRTPSRQPSQTPGATPQLKPKNVIHEMIDKELELECRYLQELNIVLVRLDTETHKNPVLSEW